MGENMIAEPNESVRSQIELETAEGLARMLKLSPFTIRRLGYRGLIREYRCGRAVRYRVDAAERARQSQRLRAESRARIAEILTPEQRARYEQMTASRAAAGRAASGRVWVLDDTGRPTAVDVRVGLTDGMYSEIVGGTLQEGTQVIVGLQGDTRQRTQAKGGPRFGF
jgi:DNA-binding TFAR19-related protein (PDSD5 family)